MNMNAAAPKKRDFAITKKSMGNERVHTIPIKAAKEHPGIWARMKVTAFSKIGGKG